MTSAKSSLLCMYGRGKTVSVDVGRMLTAHVSNVYRCGSPWSCPLCAPVVRQRRAQEIDSALRRHLDAGGGALFLTLTLRHKKRDTLVSRLDVIAQCMRLVLTGAPWARRKTLLGYIGNIKAIEITWGESNGWHAHAHVLLLFERPVTEIERCDLDQWIFGRWQSIAMRRGLGSVTRAHGIDLRHVRNAGELAQYLTIIDDESNWSPGLELTRSDLKRWSPFDLLAEMVKTGDMRHRPLWLEYEQATFGRRAIVWSPGLRRRLTGIEQEATDESLAASEGLDLTLLRALVPTDVWNRLVANGTDAALLNEIEDVAAVLLYIADLLGVDVPPLDLMEAHQHGEA
jgi:hypothetical protein